MVETVLFWLVGIAAFFVVAFTIALRLGKAASKEPPRPPSFVDKVFQKCHYCNKSVYIDEPFLKRRCPNCNENDCCYHADCGRDLYHKKQRCNGADVSDPTGHTLSLSYNSRNMCAQCGLAKEHWQEWTCSHSPRVPPSRRIYFTDDDKVWLRSHRITTEEVEVR